jgi:hypothetical protein
MVTEMDVAGFANAKIKTHINMWNKYQLISGREGVTEQEHIENNVQSVNTVEIYV